MERAKSQPKKSSLINYHKLIILFLAHREARTVRKRWKLEHRITQDGWLVVAMFALTIFFAASENEKNKQTKISRYENLQIKKLSMRGPLLDFPQ